jgi:phospholipase C
MRIPHEGTRTLQVVRAALGTAALLQLSINPLIAVAQSAPGGAPDSSRTPIKHVIVIIGENRSFDHVFATYAPQPGESVRNLLSEGIVTLDASKNAVAGPYFARAQQFAAADLGGSDPFLLNPPKHQYANNRLPAPLTGGPSGAQGYFSGTNPCGNGAAALECAMQSESGLPEDYYKYLIMGGTGQKSHVPDERIANVNTLTAGPFQLTNSAADFNYHDYSASPVHRFYQMWQQLNCALEQATPRNPSGCDGSLFSWVEVTIGAGSNGTAQAANFSTEFASGVATTGEGSSALGFYNMQLGDAPYFKFLADHYAMSDNFHQSVDGGTGANHIMLGHGDAIWFSDGKGRPAKPPEGVTVYSTYDNQANPDKGVVHEIENPNPANGTNNWYKEDGYGVADNAGSPPPYPPAPVSGGGSYSNCSDPNAPGVAAVVKYLQSLPRPIDPHCEAGHYYLLNNYNPGWFGNGKNAYIDTNPANTPFTIPPSSTRSIGDSLNDAQISWKYYGDQWNNYVNDPYQINYGSNGKDADEYCNICNPFQYDTSIMADPAQVAAHIADSANLYGRDGDIAKGRLPAVSFVKPSGYVDGHPASSKLDLFEGFARKIVDAVEASPYAKDTAIFITFDEGGGYYDSGYVQPLDFFGDGTRIPLMVIAPNIKAGHISHAYADHVSILKFIERNWGLKPVTYRSRDNLENPVSSPDNPYVPSNTPAISDLFDFFDFAANH